MPDDPKIEMHMDTTHHPLSADCNSDSVTFTTHPLLLVDGSSGAINLERELADVMVERFQLWKERQRKYGSTNIAMFGAKGCVVRLADKLARLREALFHDKGTDVDDESVEDSFMDAGNYADMGLLCLRGKWPGVSDGR